MKKIGSYVISCLPAILLTMCAFDIVHVKQIPVKIESGSSVNSPFQLEKDENISVGSGYSRTLRKGTKWRYVGTIQYGDVFRTSDQILTVEASNIHEAYIVVSAMKLVGFYLPVERTYSPLSDPVSLTIKTIETTDNK